MKIKGYTITQQAKWTLNEIEITSKGTLTCKVKTWQKMVFKFQEERFQSLFENLACTEILSWKFKLQRIFSMTFWRPWSCVGILWIFNTWNGLDIFSTYMIVILRESKSEVLNPKLAPIIVGTIALVASGKILITPGSKSIHGV